MKIKILDPRLEQDHFRPATPGSAAFDLRACVHEPVELFRGGGPALIPCGFAAALMPGTAMMLLPRSGRGHRDGLVLGNLVGLIDADYREQVFVSAWLRYGAGAMVTINPMERIAQAVVVPVVRPTMMFVDEIDQTERIGGFGSTGS